MTDCKFCNLNPQDFANTRIDETEHFFLVPAVGCLVEGYLLLVSKRHIFSMAELTPVEKDEYLTLLTKYRNLFDQIYGKYPIVFEHGSIPFGQSTSSSSIYHAHTHIVNHHFKQERALLTDLRLEPISSFKPVHANYIFYLAPDGTQYLSTQFPPVSQQMRRYIASDLGISQQYNWKTTEFPENLAKTIQTFTQ